MRKTCSACLLGLLAFSASADRLAPLARADDLFAPLTRAELGLGAYRSDTGLPAPNYWQQQVDYRLHARLEVEPKHRAVTLTGQAEVTYHNRSPEPLSSLYFLLDLNRLQPGAPSLKPLPQSAGLGFQQLRVTHNGAPLPIHIEHTLMRVDLPEALAPGASVALQMQWQLALPDKVSSGTRAGVEWLADNSPIVVAAQWFPRAAAFTDAGGWSLKPFLGQGEFSTEFGDYQVTLDVPANFTVAASGAPVPNDAASPVDAETASRHRAKGVSTRRIQRHFSSQQPLRDFTFAASPAFIVQRQADAHNRQLLAFYPQEAAPLWQRFALPAAEYTLQVFDQAMAPLPYSHISLVNAAGHGMEYPGLATVATRPDRPESSADLPAWDALTKYDFIGTVIHELGHNYVPMVVNTLEREWAWLDEGLVSFIEYRAEHGWEGNFDVIYGEPRSVAAYMASAEHQPIMTQADALQHKIANAYNKTAVSLNLLRYLVLGPETFDAALKNFYQAWQFKRPLPGDFFRAMDAAAGEDLSWFWRSFFFTASQLDVSITGLQCNGKRLSLAPAEPPAPPALANNPALGKPAPYHTETHPALADHYTQNSPPPAPPTQAQSPARPRCKLEIARRGEAIAPIPVWVGLSNAQVRPFTLPATAWQQASRRADGNLALQWPLALAENETIQWLQLDPNALLPDTNPANNSVKVIP